MPTLNKKLRSRRNRSNNRKHYNASGRKRFEQHGGSPAYNLTMKDNAAVAPMNDYVVSDRIRDGTYDVSLGALEPKCQQGGSLSSNIVMEQLKTEALTDIRGNEWPLEKGDINSLKLYQTTGGSRHRKTKTRKNHKSHKKSHNKSHRKNKSKNSRSHKKRHNQRGGMASDIITTLYSQGPINNPSGYNKDLMYPDSMPLAGSGAPITGLDGANVKHVGAPLV